jgi:hypothetical protein
MHQHDYDASRRHLEERQAAERQFFEDKAAVQVAQFERGRNVQRRVFENKQRKIGVRGEIARDPEKLWNLAQLQRLEDLSGAQAIRGANATLPSSKVTRSDIHDENVIILSLPPLSGRAKPKGRRQRCKA